MQYETETKQLYRIHKLHLAAFFKACGERLVKVERQPGQDQASAKFFYFYFDTPIEKAMELDREFNLGTVNAYLRAMEDIKSEMRLASINEYSNRAI